MVASRRQRGFSYVIMMFVVAVLSIVTVRALENSMTKERRDKEAQLLWIGQAYSKAIQTYYENKSGYQKNLPTALADLLPERDGLNHRIRPLRKLYLDPMTGGADWGLIMSSDGTGLIGVYSKSTRKPIKTGGFPPALLDFIHAQTYQDWRFVYQPT